MRGIIYRAFSEGYDRRFAFEKEDGVQVVDLKLPLGISKYEATKLNRQFKIVNAPEGIAAKWSLYLDGTLTPRIPVTELVEGWLANADIAFFRHPHRNCPFEEIEACVARNKITKAQAKKAREVLGLYEVKRNRGLYACGLIARRIPQPTWLLEIQQVWFDMMEVADVWRDQPFLPAALSEGADMSRVHVIDADIFDNEWFNFRSHRT